MTKQTLTWVEQDTNLGASTDLTYSTTLLRAVQHGLLDGPIVRLYRPEATVSFGQQEVRLNGFEAARHTSGQQGFATVIRRVGGRAAAYHQGSLVVDHLQPDDHAMAGFEQRFEYFGELLTSTLRRLGVNAAVGEIPGEYCAGEYSVHAVLESGQRVKLAGTAQRVVKGAWLFSTSLVIENSAPIREVLTDVYQELGLDLEPSTVGAVEDAVGGVMVEEVIDALQLAYEQQFLSGGLNGQDTYRFAPMTWPELLRLVPVQAPEA